MKQYKDFETTIKDVDEKGRVLVAANAIGNVDADKQISETGSFDKTLKENFHRLKWFLNHDKNLLLGVPIEGKQVDSQLQMLGQLNMKKQLSKDTYEDYKLYAEYGKSLEHSIGVEAVKADSGKEVQRVFEWKLWEYSTLYSWGANEMTPMLGLKSQKDIAGTIDFLDIMFKKGNYTDKRYSEIEQLMIKLKSLSTEPDDSTQEKEPIAKTVRNWKQLTTFINN